LKYFIDNDGSTSIGDSAGVGILATHPDVQLGNVFDQRSDVRYGGLTFKEHCDAAQKIITSCDGYPEIPDMRVAYMALVGRISDVSLRATLLQSCIDDEALDISRRVFHLCKNTNTTIVVGLRTVLSDMHHNQATHLTLRLGSLDHIGGKPFSEHVLSVEGLVVGYQLLEKNIALTSLVALGSSVAPNQMAASLPEGGTAAGWTRSDAGTNTESQVDEMLYASIKTEGKDNSPHLDEHTPRSVSATGATMRSKQGSTCTRGDLENKGGTTDRDHVTVQATEATTESQALKKPATVFETLRAPKQQLAATSDADVPPTPMKIPLVSMEAKGKDDSSRPGEHAARSELLTHVTASTKEDEFKQPDAEKPPAAIAPKKQGPGRPRKHPLQGTDTEAPTATAADATKKRGLEHPRKHPLQGTDVVKNPAVIAPKKRGPGRPRKHSLQGIDTKEPTAADATKKRGPGHPRKDSLQRTDDEKPPAAGTPKKRGPGRPRKNPLPGTDVRKSPAGGVPKKRGPGRPRKNPLPGTDAKKSPAGSVPKKQGPGRPRKNPLQQNAPKKRGPGRPRKHPLPETDDEEPFTKKMRRNDEAAESFSKKRRGCSTGEQKEVPAPVTNSRQLIVSHVFDEEHIPPESLKDMDIAGDSLVAVPASLAGTPTASV